MEIILLWIILGMLVYDLINGMMLDIGLTRRLDEIKELLRETKR